MDECALLTFVIFHFFHSLPVFHLYFVCIWMRIGNCVNNFCRMISILGRVGKLLCILEWGVNQSGHHYYSGQLPIRTLRITSQIITPDTQTLLYCFRKTITNQDTTGTDHTICHLIAMYNRITLQGANVEIKIRRQYLANIFCIITYS